MSGTRKSLSRAEIEAQLDTALANAPEPKLSHRTQIMLTDEQYRWLTVRASAINKSLAAVIRDLLDAEMAPNGDPMDDPFIQYMLSPPETEPTGIITSAETIDDELYGDPEFNR